MQFLRSYLLACAREWEGTDEQTHQAILGRLTYLTNQLMKRERALPADMHQHPIRLMLQTISAMSARLREYYTAELIGGASPIASQHQQASLHDQDDHDLDVTLALPASTGFNLGDEIARLEAEFKAVDQMDHWQVATPQAAPTEPPAPAEPPPPTYDPLTARPTPAPLPEGKPESQLEKIAPPEWNEDEK